MVINQLLVSRDAGNGAASATELVELVAASAGPEGLEAHSLRAGHVPYLTGRKGRPTRWNASLTPYAVPAPPPTALLPAQNGAFRGDGGAIGGCSAGYSAD